MRNLFLLSILIIIGACNRAPMQELKPNAGQQAMIDRKYGMFLHFGMNTYLEKQWSKGTDPASSYCPPEDIDRKAKEWVHIAKQAGMRSVLLTVKHHEGFCLWDSKYTDHDIANPSIENKVDVVKAVSDACRQQGVTFSVYYSLWDQYEPSYKDEDKHVYIDFMKNQLKELFTNYGEVGELWFDGAWDRKVEEWYLQEVYDFVKSMQPQCQISTNWTIGKRPIDMQRGDTIVYFPSDFRLWDPHLPTADDPKIYTYEGKDYYLPFECTQTISILSNWFYNKADTTVRDIEDLEEIFYKSTINDNCLLLNLAPDKEGVIQQSAVDRIIELAQLLDIENGKDFPKEIRKPQSLTSSASAEASSVLKNDTLHYGAFYAIDGDVSTAWQCSETTGWLTIDLGKEAGLQQIAIIEGGNNIQRFTIDILRNNEWVTVYSGNALSNENVGSFMGYGYGEITLEHPVETQYLRLNILESKKTPSIYSLRLK